MGWQATRTSSVGDYCVELAYSLRLTGGGALAYLCCLPLSVSPAQPPAECVSVYLGSRSVWRLTEVFLRSGEEAALCGI